jgi:hypothetical protein
VCFDRKRLTNHPVNEDAEVESVTRSAIVAGAPIESLRLQPRQFEELEFQCVMKKNE